jgi:hypothetical protein
MRLKYSYDIPRSVMQDEAAPLMQVLWLDDERAVDLLMAWA